MFVNNQRCASYKVPGGKLIRIKLVVDNNRITQPQLSGDFFLMPPEKIIRLEEAIENFSVDDIDELEDVISYVIKQENILVQGFTPKDVVLLIKKLL